MTGVTEIGLALLSGVGKALAKLLDWLVAYGAFGLFGISLIDSIGVPLPGGPDTAMILLSARSRGMMPVYALSASVGSTIGCTLLYTAARRAGAAALKRIAPKRRARIENLLGRYDVAAIMIASVMPPPFPFKPLVLSAGVFKLEIARFVVAIFLGRMVRFFAEGWLAIQFGEDAGRIIRKNGLIFLAIAGIIVVVALALKLYRGRRLQSTAANRVQPPN